MDAAGTCSVSSAIATSSSCTSKSLSDWWRLRATEGLNLYVDSLAARHSRTAWWRRVHGKVAEGRRARDRRQRVRDLELLGARAADRVRRRALARASDSDHNNHAALGLDRVAGLEVVLHRRAALQSQALLEPALACENQFLRRRRPRNQLFARAAKPPAFDLGQISAVLARFFTASKPRRRSRSLVQEAVDARPKPPQNH